MTTRPLILVTNDDGFYAEGIRALAEALTAVGEVAVIAPDREQSGVARMISLGRPLRALPRGPLRWTVDGSPTDCVYLAVHNLLPRAPDLVVSGINRGPNLADDVTYSGTVAGAMEAALLGLRAFAISLDGGAPFDYGPAAELAVRVAAFMLGREWAPRTMLNVNVPDTDGAPLTGFRWTRGGRRDYGHIVTEREDPRGRAYYWLGGNRLGFEPVEGSDCDAVHEGLAAITPLDLDLTHHALLEELAAVELPGIERR
ncbi:MAG: 5'/3'-nucleotidase SurE [Myxococcales bacterium]|nr:5'/3'-nucleotidase SurE [Myxococcales bacterium]